MRLDPYYITGRLLLISLASLVSMCTTLTGATNDRLIGFGCGPERFTFTAMEEDHFPMCEQIVERKVS